ncbi:DUF805 domain-containing protein [Modestobacter sp. VKM Ac-2977]|uniref:DUF805 domain-containing protein n=1 Tax=Modestobacter sp. VKM Ac-2977 TaxID=3004131 RepID=UPI0022AABF99|nr:DUF805 domain-containing protein [Modestobacter sp. VKM Ac-2977]MCZ2822372.1 DUF805 domain-containing protein [Modestobacter sp. VKM Ac-2977]
MSGNDGRGGPFGWYVPTGRIQRSDWWVRYVLVIALLGLVASSVDAQWFPDSYPRFEDRPGSADLADVLWFFPEEGGPVTAIVALVLAVPNVAAMVTRLHDRDHSAWWLLWGIVPVFGWLVLFITCGFLGTQPQPNRYGPPPR